MSSNRVELTRYKASGGVWDVIQHPEIKYALLDHISGHYDPYKLHISIDKNALLSQEVEKKLSELLDEALLEKTITAYKFLNATQRKINKFRNAHLPYVIYLQTQYDAENLKKVALLCRKIEELLQQVKPSEAKNFSVCDIPVSKHIVFRQSARTSFMKRGFKEYVSADDKTLAPILKEDALNSEHYKSLVQMLAPPKNTQRSNLSNAWRAVCRFFSGIRKLFTCCFPLSAATTEHTGNVASETPLKKVVASHTPATSSNVDYMLQIGGTALSHTQNPDTVVPVTAVPTSSSNIVVPEHAAVPDPVTHNHNSPISIHPTVL